MAAPLFTAMPAGCSTVMNMETSIVPVRVTSKDPLVPSMLARCVRALSLRDPAPDTETDLQCGPPPGASVVSQSDPEHGTAKAIKSDRQPGQIPHAGVFLIVKVRGVLPPVTGFEPKAVV